MIWSVSMFVYGNTAVRALNFLMGSIAGLTAEQFAWIGDAPAHRTGRRGERTGEHGARALALPALKVAIAGAHGQLAGADVIAVHADAHRATGFAPVTARVDEYAIQPLGLRGPLD